ncbi:Inhibitor of growth protein 5 [Taenia crassiceps]|uniref:Inhibitor of growth protein 5 n=1 Tax=Taenia crassiceps TaxID=6207 RepID=A0ABR4QK36_9CEST
MEYFQKFLDELEQAPPYLQQEFKIIRDLDQKVQDITNEAQVKTSELLRIARDLPKDERIKRLNEIQNLFQTAEEICNDKVSRAESIYELVDRQIQRLDADMIEFKRASVLKEMKKSRNKTPLSAPSRIPASAALALALTNNPGDVLDMPIDPNEPTYCICQQKSRPKPAVTAPFKSPLRSRNGDQRRSTLPLSPKESKKPGQSTPSKRERCGGVISPERKNFCFGMAVNEEEKEHELDEAIKVLQKRICEVRGLETFTVEDMEGELKMWRELLHEYNDAKDACLYVFGQLAHIKMTTVKNLYAEYDLDMGI